MGKAAKAKKNNPAKIKTPKSVVDPNERPWAQKFGALLAIGVQVGIVYFIWRLISSGMFSSEAKL